jgi:hypothetical protein
MPPQGLYFSKFHFHENRPTISVFEKIVRASAVNFREHNLNIREPTHIFSVILKKI